MAEPLIQAGMVRRRYAFLWIAVAALLVAGIACTCNNLPIPSLNPTPVPPTQAGGQPDESGGKPGGGGQPGGSQGGGTIDLAVYNGTGNSIWYIYISPTSSSSWGDDWLGSSTLSAGETISFSVPAGSYDLRADDSSHNVVEQQMGVALTSPYTWSITGSGGSSSGGGGATVALTLVNQASSTVCYVRISPTSSSTWGDDWLGSDTISAGASYTFYVPSGDYDLRAEFCGGGQVEEFGVGLYTDQNWYVSGGGSSSGGSPSGGGTINLTVYNGTGNSIWYIYISPTTSSSWGDDWLGSSTLSAGETTSFSVPAGSYDLKAEDSSHNVVEQQMGVSLSSSYTWYVTGSGGGSSGGSGATLTVYNYTSSSVCFMRISPTSSSSWGDDWLGADTISSGESYTFYVTPGDYDLRAEYCGGGDSTQFGVSIYGNITWTLQ
jgi:hypothetical protein